MKRRKLADRIHMVIPDGQVRPGVDLSHWTWIGNYIVEKRPDVIVNIGDFADMVSLNSYAVGKAESEGTRYADDIAVTKEAMNKLLGPIRKYNRGRAKKYKPEMHLTLGNHEHRITREAESNPKLIGTISVDDLGYRQAGWKVHDFLKVVEIDKIKYAHYFISGSMGRPVSSAAALLRTTQCSATMGHVQRVDVAIHPQTQNIGLFSGICLESTHKILTSDLRYVPLKTVKVGDKVVSFDEESPGRHRTRRYKTGTVQAIEMCQAELFEVTLASGKIFRATEKHRWLTKLGSSYRWTTTAQLQPATGNRHGTHIPRLLDEWDSLSTFDTGWLSGLYDGEGCLSVRPTSGGGCFQLALSQKEGPVLERARSILSSIGYDDLTYTYDRTASTLRIKGGSPKIVSLLGKLRPTRLLAKFSPENIGELNRSKSFDDEVISVRPCGVGEIARIAIDSGTMIVEGFGHHNCYLHDEGYLTPQGQNTKRGIWMKHEVRNGTYDPMFVSLDFLKRKYS